MSKEEDKKDKLKIIWIDGIPCMELPLNTIMKKGQSKSVKHPFRFGCMQQQKKKDFMPDMIRELDQFFNTPYFPVKWKIYTIKPDGQIKELKDEDEENDNAK